MEAMELTEKELDEFAYKYGIGFPILIWIILAIIWNEVICYRRRY